MPFAPLKPCKFSGCGELVDKGVSMCEQHRKVSGQAERFIKGSAWQRGYDTAWSKVRLRALKRDNFLCQCEECLGAGRMVPATDVDHKIPFHGKNDPLRLDLNNLQSLSSACHARKTARADGGFGNKKQQEN